MKHPDRTRIPAARRHLTAMLSLALTLGLTALPAAATASTDAAAPLPAAAAEAGLSAGAAYAFDLAAPVAVIAATTSRQTLQADPALPTRFAYTARAQAGGLIQGFAPGTDQVDLTAVLTEQGWTGTPTCQAPSKHRAWEQRRLAADWEGRGLADACTQPAEKIGNLP